MDTTIVNTGNGNIINTGNGGGNIDAAIQISSSSAEGATSSNAINRAEVVAGDGNSSGDTEIANQSQVQGISSQITDDEKALDEYVRISIEKNLVAYNAITLKRLYPRAWGLFLAYCKTKANDMEEMDEETAMGIMLAAPRTVIFDFFDQKDIFTNTEYNGKWAYNIKTRNILIQTSYEFGVRITAEIAAFQKAFEILEEKI